MNFQVSKLQKCEVSRLHFYFENNLLPNRIEFLIFIELFVLSCAKILILKIS